MSAGGDEATAKGGFSANDHNAQEKVEGRRQDHKAKDGKDDGIFGWARDDGPDSVTPAVWWILSLDLNVDR